MDEHKCHDINVLKKPNDTEAMRLLVEAARQVQPIMQKRAWTVRKLSEFSPRNPK